MAKRLLLLVIVVGMLALTGCDALDTGDTDEDPEAAQSFFPTITGFNVQESGGIQDAIIAALGGASVLTANPVQAALVERVDTLLDCYRERGALDVKIYTEDVSNISEPRVPLAGVLAVVNLTRIQDNFASCIMQSPRALTVSAEPCVGSGSFDFEGDSIHYFYAAIDTPLCDIFRNHFNQWDPQR